MSLLNTTPTRQLVGGDARGTYDRVASSYDWFREQWLRIAGGDAEQAMLDDLAPLLWPGARVLDAGCGTGALSRQMLARCPSIELTMLDLSPEMLARTADLPGTRLQGSVLELPFADARFDLVVSAWVVETVTDPRSAVAEMVRMLAPGGRLVYTFCSLPEGWFSRAGSALLRAAVEHGFAGEFLDREHTPWHDCGSSHRRRFHGGLTTEVALGACCAVGPGLLPGAAPRGSTSSETATEDARRATTHADDA